MPKGYIIITENPTFGLGKIKVDQTPTDYFPPHEFDKIVDATYAYRENRGEPEIQIAPGFVP